MGESRVGESYLGELKRNARPLVAASLGCGTSLPLFAYTNSVFAPHLIEEFGWSRAQFALIGITMLVCVPILPLIGRLTDLLGVRRVALIGSVLVPLFIVGYAMQTGSFLVYALLFTCVVTIGAMTGPMVYSRLIAERFDRAQGLALTIINCAPSLLAVPISPLLNVTIEHYGWREAYLGLAALVLVVSLTAVWLTDPHRPDPDRPVGAARTKAARADYALILHSRVFWTILVAFFLCLLQTQLHSSQMNVMLIDQGLTKQVAANVVAVYAIGTLVGRVACGLALDRYSTRIVTAVSMFIPAFGFLMLGSPVDTVVVITTAMFLVGVSVGAESDLLAFLIARYFKLRIYGTTAGLVHSISFLASALGGVAISLTLHYADSFTPFLLLVAGTIATGALLFLLLPKERDFEKIG